MVIFLILTAVICLPGIKLAPVGQLHKDYISKNQTMAINGIFTLLVFWSHVCTYIKLDSTLDTPYTAFKDYMLQAIVVPFLFYSGYGMTESIKVKGKTYTKQIPVKRFLPLLLHFDIAIVMYLVVYYAFGKTYPLKDIMLSLIGYSSVGNSNWYIFAMLCLYIIVFAAFMIAGKNMPLGVILATVFSICLVVVQILLKRDSWNYDTLILFSVGMIYSLVKPLIEKIIAMHDLVYLAALAAAVVMYLFFYKKRSGGLHLYSMWAILFMAIVILFTMKIKIGNPVLGFFGSHVFSIYILQRIPMIIFSKLGLDNYNKYLFVVLCFAITVIMAIAFDKFTERLDNLIFTKSKKV